jgi:hypothetical protein
VIRLTPVIEKISACRRRRIKRYDSTGLLTVTIAAYIQVQYRVIGVHPTGLTVARGVGRCPQGYPQALALAGRRRGQRSNLCGGAH